MKRLAIFIISFIFFCINSSAFAYEFEVLSTTDMHGRANSFDVTSKEKCTNSMTKVATVIKEERKKYSNNILLIDNGDLIQGTLLMQYAIAIKDSEENPMVTALKKIGYDIWVMGNHEFNYTPEQRDFQIKSAKASGIAVLGGNIVLKQDGTNIDGKSVRANSPFYTPYIIKTFTFDNNKKVRVAIIGLGNSNNASWDRQSNFPNLQFMSINNPNGYLEVEIARWVKEIKAQNLADIIIVSAHTGKSTDDGVVSNDFVSEAQAITGTKKAKGIDLLIYGHDHKANMEKIKTLDNKEIYIVNAGGTTVSKNVFDVKFDKNNKFKSYTTTAELLQLKDYIDDQELSYTLQPWNKECKKWASKSHGKFAGGWNKIQNQVKNKTNNDLVLTQTEISNFIHKVQIWASWRNYETKGIKGATVSMSSSCMAKDKDGRILFVPKDNKKISMLDSALLYRFSNNMLATVDMTPKQLYRWLNTIANHLTVNKEGKVQIKEGESLYGTDTFYGIDYEFDLSKPENKRIVYAKINGQDLLTMDEPIRVVLTSYRLAGGHGFKEVTNISENDAIWTSTDYFDDEHANIQSQIIDYIENMKIIKPDDSVPHSYNSKWNIRTK